MPLVQGSSRADISRNIAAEIRAGKPQKQAAAIAYSVARKNGGKDAGQEHSPANIRALMKSFLRFMWEEEKEPTADAVPKGRAASVLFLTKDGKALLLKRADDEDNWPGTWNFPGGQVDDGEEPLDAARREAMEECGLDADFAFDPQPLYMQTTPNDWEHTTYLAELPETFEPKLNGEHSEHKWVGLDELPLPLHPGITRLMAALDEQGARIKRGANDSATLAALNDPAAALAMDWSGRMALRDGPLIVGLAFDKESVRRYDNDGRMHVERSHISKANICEYYGEEIPGFKELGLDPKRKYKMLRDPEEMAKPETVESFNGIPLLITHIPTHPDAHPHNETIGTTGTTAEFDGEYMDNGLSVWTREGLDAIESGMQKELSSSYAYVPVMEPGMYKGQHYDGKMTQIRGNHVAAVVTGRVGPDVKVPDSMPLDMQWDKLESALAELGISA